MAAPVVHFEIHGKDGKQVQDSGIGGGITKGDASMVTVYVEVPDLQASLQKAESLGGKTAMPPAEVPGGPTIAQFKDPAGNTIGLIKSGSMPTG
jgi:predicted enzyme related to lactoylglutathione lyase